MTRSIKIAAGKLFPAVLSLALLALPSSLFAGGNATTYYSKLTVQRAGTGEGKIYAANAETSTPVYRMEPMTVTMSGSGNHEYYIYAEAPVGTTFKGWSATGATLKDSAALSTTATIIPSGTSAAEATPATITANFEEITYAAFSVKFSPPTTNGSYQVDGQDVSSAEIVRGAFTKVYRPALVATPDAGYAFYGWYESTDGGKTKRLLSRAATFSPSLTSNSIITAEFTVGAPAVTYDGLISALATNDITEIPEEATIFVPANEVLTIPAGKSLLVNGKLILSGTINNQGDIGGSSTINLIKYEITQTGNGATPIVTETIRTSDQKKYYKTSVAAVSSAITGNAATCNLVNGARVVRNGAEIAVAAYPIEATPVVFACKIDSSKALNHVTDFLSTPYYESVGKGMAAVKGKGATQMLILLADNKLIQNDASSAGILVTQGNYQKLDGNFGTMDLAGKKLTINTSYINSYSHTVLGGQLQVSTLMYSGTVTAINCSSVTFTKIKEDYASVINIYDLTGTGTTASRIISAYNGSNAIKNAVNFYSSSTASYTASQFLPKAANSYHIYGGKWNKGGVNPPDAKYIASIFAAEYEFHEVSDGAAKVWKLEEKNDKSVFEVEGGLKYETLEGGAAKLFEASDSVKIKLLRNAVLDEPITIPEGKTLEVELSGCCITAAKGFAINHGTLILGDEKANLSSTGGRIVTIAGNLIENDGIVDITYGYYTGNIVLNEGRFTTHHGRFEGTFSGDKDYVDLRGGYFTKDVSSLLKDGYYRTNGYVGPFPMPTISKTWVTSNGGYWKYTFKTLPAADLNLYNSTSNEKKAYTLENWVRRAEIRSMIEQYPPASYMVDIGVGFDRDVASGSASATVTKPVTQTEPLPADVAAGTLYRILSPYILGTNSTQKKYSAFLSESTFQDAIFGIYGNNSVNNGTTANLHIDLCVGSNENPTSKYALMSEYTVIGAGSNQAMIQPASGAATFYATISAAVSKVAEGGTIKLCNDITSTDTITISKACKIDTNGMNFEGKIVAGNGYYLKRETEVNSVEKMLGKSRTIYTIKKIGSEHITVKAVAKSQVYGEDATELSYEVEGLEEGDAGLTGALTRAPGSDVGTYVIQQGTLKHPYYSIDFVSASYTITPKTITVTAEPKTQVYGDEQTELDYSAEGLVGGDSLSGNPTREKGNDVGTYEIQQGTLTNSNYTINFVPAKYTITPKPITVTAADQTQVYGAGAVVLTWNAPGLVGEDTLTGELAREPGTAVGTYAISQGNLGNPNYTITFVPATYTITKKPITVTAADKSQVYGDEPVTLTWNTSGLVGGDMLTGELTRVPGTAVGTYAISQGNLTNPNYTITFVGATYTITKKRVTVTAADKSQVYGAEPTELTYTTEGLEAGDTLTGELAREPGTAVGTYKIQQGTLAHHNYIITFVDATYTITKKPVTVTAADKTQVYGSEPTELTYTTEGLEAGDTLTGGLAREEGEDVGEYNILVGTLDNPNYAITFVGATYTITKKSVIVTAADKSQVYGATPTELTYTTEGLEAGDTLTGELAREEGNDVGTYKVLQGTLAHPNYTINLVPATYTITPKTITVTADAKSQVYGGDSVELTYNVDGLEEGDSLTGSLTRAPGNSVGEYTIQQGTLAASDNYTISFVPAIYTITKKQVKVTAVAKSQVYGGEPVALTYNVEGLEEGDTLSGSLTRAPGDNVGQYEIQVGTLTNANYTISFSPAKYTITSKTITVTADAKSQVYGSDPVELTYNVEGLEDGDSLTGLLTRAQGNNVGTYEIQQGTLTASDNYSITFVPAIYTITKKPITVTADTKLQAYGAEEIPLTYKAVGLREGDELAGELERAPGTEIGKYEIKLGTLDNPNYDIAFVSADYEIVAKTIEISVNELAADAKPDYLDAAFRFVAGEEVAEYHDWEANFLVSFDRPVSKGSVVLAGTYSAPWGTYPWTTMELENDLEKGDEWKLLPSSGEGSVTYGDLIKIDQFDCGVKNLSAANAGTIMTVRLVISGNGKTIEIAAKTYELVVDIANHFEEAEYSIDEGESVEIKVCGGSTLRAVQTTVSLVKGTGTYSAAYMDGKKITLPRVLNWAKGDLEPKTIIFMTKASKKAEGDKFFTLQLGANVGEGIGEGTNIAKVTICDIQEGETPRYVTALAYPAHAGTVSGAGKLTKVGQIRTLTAKPKSFDKFGGWYKAMDGNPSEIDFGAPVEPANPKKPMTIKVDEEGTYIAYFTDVLPIASSEISETEGVFVDGAIKAQVGVKFMLPISFSDDSGKGKLAAKGLPSGLKLVRDKKTREYSITGVPTKAGSFMATFTASNAAGKSTVKYAFEVEALPTVAIGTKTEVIIENNAQIGTIKFTAGKTGTISAKVKIGKKTYSFSTKGYDAAVDDKLIVTLPHKSGLMLTVSIDIDSGEVAFDLIR